MTINSIIWKQNVQFSLKGPASEMNLYCKTNNGVRLTVRGPSPAAQGGQSADVLVAITSGQADRRNGV